MQTLASVLKGNMMNKVNLMDDIQKMFLRQLSEIISEEAPKIMSPPAYKWSAGYTLDGSNCGFTKKN